MRTFGRAFVLALVILAACDPVGKLEEYFYAESPREAYIHRLEQAGLTQTALVRDFLAAGAAALRDAPLVEVPFAGKGTIEAAKAAAAGFRFHVRRGERVILQTSVRADSGTLVFIDVFRIPDDSLDSPTRTVSADSGMTTLAWEPRRTGEYVLRLQPELLRSGEYEVTIGAEAALTFPVPERGRVGSTFGDPRDGGRRDHHGIDIFAPRGTPAIAAASGYVSRVRETPRGGKVVWLRDERRGLSLYYAHLDSQVVTSGARVDIGDTVGFVGNTGNARTTPPHLHFGIYSRGEGPLDPYPFVVDRASRR